MNTKDTRLELLAKIEELTALLTADDSPTNESRNRRLRLTEKEIMQMPKSVRKKFRIQGREVRCRIRNDGRYKHSVEIRYHRDGYSISASGTTLELAKERFIQKLQSATPKGTDPTFTVPTTFNGFSMYWFENFHRAKVIEKTYQNNLRLYNRHVKDKLGDYQVKSVTPMMLKELLAALPGNGKTEDDVHSLLNQVLDTAVRHGLIQLNPLGMLVHSSHERESGIDLTTDEQLTLMQKSHGTAYEAMFAFMLYAGLRPNEIKTVRIDGNFVEAVNSKRKNGKTEYKRIPIISHLRRHITNFEKLGIKSEQSARVFFNSIIPNHTLKDLRKTFHTKCVSCKLDFFARKQLMGHSVGKLDKTYTGTLDDYLENEAQKLEQWYDSTPNVPQKMENKS